MKKLTAKQKKDREDYFKRMEKKHRKEKRERSKVKLKKPKGPKRKTTAKQRIARRKNIAVARSYKRKKR